MHQVYASKAVWKHFTMFRWAWFTLKRHPHGINTLHQLFTVTKTRTIAVYIHRINTCIRYFPNSKKVELIHISAHDTNCIKTIPKLNKTKTKKKLKVLLINTSGEVCEACWWCLHRTRLPLSELTDGIFLVGEKTEVWNVTLGGGVGTCSSLV